MNLPVQVDGKTVFVIGEEVIKAVVVPGKLVNLLTKASRFVTVLNSEIEEGTGKEIKTLFAKCEWCGAVSDKWPSKALFDMPSGTNLNDLPFIKEFRDKHAAERCQ